MIGCRNCEQRPDGDCGAHGPPNAGRGAHVVGAVVPAPGLRDCQELPTIRLADALEAEVARLTAELAEARERGVAWAKEMQEPAACGHRKGVVSYPADGPPDCAPCRVEAAERRADAALLRANAADDRAEIARGDASDWRAGKRIAEAAHAAEHEKRAAAEAREKRLREVLGECGGSRRCRWCPATRASALLADPADDSALRAHVAAAVAAERESCAAVLDAVVREHRDEDRRFKAEIAAEGGTSMPVHGEPGYFCEDFGCGSIVDLAAAIRQRGAVEAAAKKETP